MEPAEEYYEYMEATSSLVNSRNMRIKEMYIKEGSRVI